MTDQSSKTSRTLTEVHKTGYTVCADCGETVEYASEWDGETDGIGYYMEHAYCPGCGRHCETRRQE